jgi:hypothetical protein
VRAVLIVIHLLLGAGWLGAMAYSLFVLQPRAAGYFASDDRGHERFLATVASGARWKVLGVVAAIGASGLALAMLDGRHDGRWYAGVAAKAGLLLVALAVFCWVSWRAWPARVLALPEEGPVWRRRFRLAGLALMSCAALASVLGVLVRGQTG